MRNDRATPIIAEAVGTLLFFFVGAGAIVTATAQEQAGAAPLGLIEVALAHGLALAVLVSALGAVSGAHFNPAVTLAVWVAGRIPGNTAVGYVVAQLVGALGAGLLLRAIFPESVWSVTAIGTPALGAGMTPLSGIVVEAVLTVLLVFAVFGTAVDPRAPRIGGLAIGLAVAADILMGGPLTGAAVNPARWFGPAAASLRLDNGYVWIAGPLLGALVAALLYRYLFLPEAEPERTPAAPTAG